MAGHVLVVEDEANITEALRFILSRDGWQVETESDGDAALARIRRTSGQPMPDLLILDLMLPGASGFDILRALRADPKGQNLPVLMLTAKGQMADREMATRLGVTRFMTKPFANSDIVETVRELFDP